MADGIGNSREETNMWNTGKMNGYSYQVKHYEEGSVYGIDEGRISKLWIYRDGETFAEYERGWCLEPTDPGAFEVYERLLEWYN